MRFYGEFEVMSYHWSAGCVGVAVTFINEGGYRRWVAWTIDPNKGQVWYSSADDIDED